MTFRHRPNVNTPLGLLIAGEIDQAEYRRRMADLERRAADSLDVEPEPMRWRLVPPPPRRPHWIVLVGLVIASWLVLLTIGWLLIHALIWVQDATSRSAAAPHDPAARGEMAGVVRVSARAWDTSGVPLTGAPHEREGGTSWASPMDRHDGGAP